MDERCKISKNAGSFCLVLCDASPSHFFASIYWLEHHSVASGVGRAALHIRWLFELDDLCPPWPVLPKFDQISHGAILAQASSVNIPGKFLCGSTLTMAVARRPWPSAGLHALIVMLLLDRVIWFSKNTAESLSH